MADSDSPPTSPIAYGSMSRTYRAEDDIDGGSRALAQALAPVVAVVPWLMTVGGLWAMGRASESMAARFQTDWVWVLGGLAALVVAALVWAAVIAWSSSGALAAGLCSLVAGVALSIPGVMSEVYSALPSGGGRSLWYVVTSGNFMLLGSLLLAAGLGASAARRLRR